MGLLSWVRKSGERTETIGQSERVGERWTEPGEYAGKELHSSKLRRCERRSTADLQTPLSTKRPPRSARTDILGD